MVVPYETPTHLILYDPVAIALPFAEAKAAVMALTTMPYQRRWVEALQEVQLKREVAGTSRIEGAEFTERELDAAINETPEQLFTRYCLAVSAIDGGDHAGSQEVSVQGCDV